MINDLTSEQESLMSIIRDEWIKVPFDTCSVNKYKAETAINLTYESMQENKPEKIVWFHNPLHAVTWMIDNLQYLQKLKEVPGKNYKTGSFSAVSHQITWEDELIHHINRDVPHNITKQFENNFNRIIHRKYLHWLSQSFLADLLNVHLHQHLCYVWREEQYWTMRKGSYHEIETVEVIGMHDIYYLALASFYHAIGYDRSEFRGYWESAKYCGLWWAFADVAVVIPKPIEIHLDSEYRLHATKKPALVYSGFESYANHGKYINPSII
jgi:hypothetical protein